VGCGGGEGGSRDDRSSAYRHRDLAGNIGLQRRPPGAARRRLGLGTEPYPLSDPIDGGPLCPTAHCRSTASQLPLNCLSIAGSSSARAMPASTSRPLSASSGPTPARPRSRVRPATFSLSIILYLSLSLFISFYLSLSFSLSLCHSFSLSLISPTHHPPFHAQFVDPC